MVQELVEGGTFLLNCPWEEQEIAEHLPGQLKRYIAENKIRFYVIDAAKIGMETGMGATRINTILQAAFFKLADILPETQVMELLKDAVRRTYGKKGEDIVEKNCAAIDAGMQGIRKIELKQEWLSCESDDLFGKKICARSGYVSDYVNHIQRAVNAFEGNKLPVSAFLEYASGAVPSGTAAYEKRNIAVRIPHWIAGNCIECNICSYVCPHAVIRPVAMDHTERQKAPSGMVSKDMRGAEKYQFAITVSVLDCTGCGTCAACCPAKDKALVMEPTEKYYDYQKYYEYGRTIKEREELWKNLGFQVSKAVSLNSRY